MCQKSYGGTIETDPGLVKLSEHTSEADSQAKTFEFDFSKDPFIGQKLKVCFIICSTNAALEPISGSIKLMVYLVSKI
jgi:hypothetical protein